MQQQEAGRRRHHWVARELHDRVGNELAVALRQLELVELHLRFHTFRMGWSDSAVRRYVRDAGPLLDRLNQLTRADATTANPFKKKALADLQDELELRIARLAEQENLEAIRPSLDGNEVMEHLGIRPGPVVGKALESLLEHRMERGPIPKDEAYRLLDEWAAEQGIERRGVPKP